MIGKRGVSKQGSVSRRDFVSNQTYIEFYKKYMIYSNQGDYSNEIPVFPKSTLGKLKSIIWRYMFFTYLCNKPWAKHRGPGTRCLYIDCSVRWEECINTKNWNESNLAWNKMRPRLIHSNNCHKWSNGKFSPSRFFFICKGHDRSCPVLVNNE